MSSLDSRLHIVTADEAALYEQRSQALQLFASRYKDGESRETMTNALIRMVHRLAGEQETLRTFRWELVADEELLDDLWRQGRDTTQEATNTLSRDWYALKAMMHACWKVGLISEESHRRIKDQARPKHVGVARKPPGKLLTEDNLVDIVTSCANGPGHVATRARDVALLLVMSSSGIRASEAGLAQVNNLDEQERNLYLTHTKGDTARYAWLHQRAIEGLQPWLDIRGRQPGPLFVPLSRTGRPLHEHGSLSYHQIWRIVTTRAAQAGHAGVTPHDLRRFMVTTLLARNDVFLVSAAVGHQKVSTTQKYDRRGQEAQRDAIDTMRLPSLPQGLMRHAHEAL